MSTCFFAHPRNHERRDLTWFNCVLCNQVPVDMVPLKPKVAPAMSPQAATSCQYFQHFHVPAGRSVQKGLQRPGFGSVLHRRVGAPGRSLHVSHSGIPRSSVRHFYRVRRRTSNSGVFLDLVYIYIYIYQFAHSQGPVNDADKDEDGDDGDD